MPATWHDVRLGTDADTHPVRRALAAQAEAFHHGVQAAVGHRTTRVHPVRKQQAAFLRHDGSKLAEPMHGLSRKRHPMCPTSLHPLGRYLPLGGVEVDLAPVPADNLVLAARREDNEAHGDASLFGNELLARLPFIYPPSPRAPEVTDSSRQERYGRDVTASPPHWKSRTAMNSIRIVAVALIVGGVLALTYGGFSYNKDTQKADIGPLHLQVTETQRVNIPLWAGIAAIVGGVVLLWGGRKS